MKKGLSINLKVLMSIVLVLVAVLIIVGLMTDNVDFLSSYGNKSLNGSIGAIK